ncbi:MAG: chromate transporter [Rhizobiales bacterium 65-9]|nr:chromate transporter [Hyphomicrobiales bacterium]OJY38373.1 MAG: chromate transporter [Rhizobiales bacterium 65-9]
MANRLVELAAIFAPLSLITIGGGQTIVADIQRQAVDVHQWMSAAEFLNAFAISRMAPGPGSLLATLIGWSVAGWAGALVASVGIFAPAALLTAGVVHLWSRHPEARWRIAMERGLRPVAAGMILATAVVLFQSLDGGWLARGVALCCTGVLLATRLNALLVLACGAAAFVGLSALLAF